jgi:hypothetical protein
MELIFEFCSAELQKWLGLINHHLIRLTLLIWAPADRNLAPRYNKENGSNMTTNGHTCISSVLT